MAPANNIPVIEKKIEGVFSIEKSVRIGTGTTARRVQQTAYYFVQEREDGDVDIQGLNANQVPFGSKQQITKDELLSDYLPEPAMYKKAMANAREMSKALARGDKFRKKGETFTAEFEYNKALQLDEENVRANFGVGICYIQRGETEKAQEVFERVVKIDAAFEDEHKHLFNEYGIQLRKSGMCGQAVDYYNRALELTQDDENLYYNLARAHFECKNWDKVWNALDNCLRINPDHPEGVKMRDFIRKKKL